MRAYQDIFNYGDLDGLPTRYEQEATLVARPGLVGLGRAAFSEALSGFLALKSRTEIAEIGLDGSWRQVIDIPFSK